MRKIYLMSLSLIFLFLSFQIGSNAQVIFSQGFEPTTFPPTGWLNNHTTGTNTAAIWERATTNALLGDDGTAAANPLFINPHTGTGMAQFRSYDFLSGNGAELITAPFSLTAFAPHKIKFWMYRDVIYNTNQDSISVYINVSRTTTGASFLGKLIRGAGQTPTVSTSGWYEYSFNIPTVYNGATNYIIFNAVSRFGNNLFIDDISVENNPSCTGTPIGGVAIASAPYLCASGNSILTLSGNTSSSGITYQWQASPAGTGTFTNISGANSNTYTATVSASTDFRCVVTCTNGGASSNSVIANVTLNPAIPTNDLICNATELILNGPEVCGNTTCATATTGELSPTCVTSTPNNIVWFKFTPTTTSAYRLVMTRPVGATSGGSLNAWVGVNTIASSCPTPGTITEVTQPSCLNLEVVTSTEDTVVTSILTAGTTYYIQFDGNSGSYGAYCLKIINPPLPPTCVTNVSPANAATNVVTTPATLSWNTSPGATSYKLIIGTTNPPPTTNPITVFGTTSAITGFTYSTQYYWYVIPNNGLDGVGCETNVTSFTTQAAPLPPVNDSCGASIALLDGVPYNGTNISSTISGAPASTCTTSTTGGTPSGDVWFKFITTVGGTATISLTNATNNLDAIITVYSGTPAAGCSGISADSCRDNGIGNGNETFVLNNLLPGTTYYFSVKGWNAQPGNFTVVVGGPALPISLLSFTGTKQDKINLLNWATASETNNKGFELQRSANGNDFASIAFVNSKAIGGNSSAQLNYTFSDITPLGGTNYYRLKQVDKDGKFSMSKVVAIKGLKPTSLQLVGVYPNPAVNKLNVNIESPVADFVTLLVTDMTGKVLMNKMKSVAVGDNTMELNVATLPAGSYFIKAVCANGCETTTAKFVKQ